ncbi:MAG: hypothetical protein AAGF92_02065 [Myxococcota bacterium]
MKIHEWKEAMRTTYGPVGLWSWRQGAHQARAFPSLEAFLRDATRRAERTDGVTVTYRRARREPQEGVVYRFDGCGSLVPDLPEGRAMQRAFLPAAQRR